MDSTSKTGPAAGAVTIQVGTAHLAVVDPPVPELQPLLEYPVRVTEPGGPTGWREAVVDMLAWQPDIKGRVGFPEGLVGAVRRRLRDLGYRVRIEDERADRPEFVRDEGFVEAQTDARAEAFLDAVGRHRTGRVEVADDADAVDRLVLLARAYPAARIAVAVPTNRERGRLTHRLGECLLRRGVWRKDEWGQDERRVRVVTFGQIGALGDRPWDVLVLPDGAAATGAAAGENIPRLDYRRLYAFVRPQRRPDGLVERRLEVMAGPVILRIRRPRGAVRVAFLPTSGVPVRVPSDPVGARRAMYWQNAPRNWVVATVAEWFMRRDGAALAEYGLDDRALAVLGRRAFKAVVLVENTEHAHALRRVLPTWGQCDSVPADGTDEYADADCPVVVTEAYAAMYPVAADVVIRAAGTPWPLRMKKFPPVREVDRPDVLVVDFRDDFHPLAREYARRRREEYGRAGMEVLTAVTTGG